MFFSSAFNVKNMTVKNITGGSRIPKFENILIAGVDNRDSIPRDIRNRYHLGVDQCNCTDTIILAHISYEKKIIRLISIPRDTYIRYSLYNIPSSEAKKVKVKESKINAAYHYGGQELLLDLVHEIFNVNIDHYVELNFLSVVNLVDGIGGVDIYSSHTVSDRHSGMRLKQGWNHLDGAQALSYSRAR
jgi:LCP family protein required for cell wall assembly